MSLTCYTAPGVAFETEEAMKEHYRSEWHRHNLKRKVAGLPPLGRDAFEQRMANQAANPSASAATGCRSLGGPPDAEASRATVRRQRREARTAERFAKAAQHAGSKSAEYEATKNMSEHEYVEHKMATAAAFDEGSDLFSRHHSTTLEDNLAHMARTHGFYIPYMDYVTDLPGLLGYLLEMVYVGNVALVSGKQFHSLEAVQAHMRATGGCRVELEGHEEEYEDYYDLAALAVKSPLWEWVEEEGEEEGEEDGEMAEAEAAEPMEPIGEASDDEEVGGGEDALTHLFEKCVGLELITDAQVDKLTDAVANGEATEAGLLAEWGTRLRNARHSRRAAASAAAASSTADDVSMATSRRTTYMRVRYRPIAPPGSTSEAGSLTFGRTAPSGEGGGRVLMEAGHRSMRTYYKQSYKPEGSTLGAADPKLHALMLQYAKAGVLSAPGGWRGGGGGPGIKHERSHTQMQRDSKAFVAQGITNNMTMKGMKHFKNQSLNF